MRTGNLPLESRRVRRGMALPATLLVIVVLTVFVAAAFSVVSSERRSTDNDQAQIDVYDLARSGLEQFVSNPTTYLATFTPPTFVGPDSAKLTFSNGYAWVLVQRVRPAVGGEPAMYVVRSRGVKTIERPTAVPVAERTIAQFAQWQAGDMQVLSAWTSMTGLQKNGASGTISGIDANPGGPGCPAPSGNIGGVAVPTIPGYTQNGGSSVPAGSPDIFDMGSQSQANGLMKIDWAGIVSGASLTPDITIPGNSWPSSFPSTYFPVIYVNQAGDFTLPGDGQGMLVVRNNLTISGSARWKGVLLVGGVLTSNGDNTVSGAVVTGLNVLLGESVPVSDVGNGTKTFQYNSCDIAKAANRFGGLAPLRNTMTDNWPSY
jgi:hypothetical protein